MADSNCSCVPLPLFHGKNYEIWSIKMRTYFRSQNLLNVIEEELRIPEDTSTLSTIQQNIQKDSQALFVLQQALADDIFPYIMRATTAKKAWYTLQEEFQGSKKAVRFGSGDCTDDETIKRYGILYVAAQEGDWGEAKKILDKHPGDVRAKLSDIGDTVLHAAAKAGNNDFLKEVVSNFMEEVDLKMKNEENKTAFHIATTLGDTELVKWMLAKDKDLAMIYNGCRLPVHDAALLGNDKMVRFLYTATKDKLTEKDRIELLVTLIDRDLYDVALDMIRDFPELAVSRVNVDQKENGKTKEEGETALHALARKPLTYYDFDDPTEGILKRYYRQLLGTDKRMHPKALQLVKLLWQNVVKRLDYYKTSDLIEMPRRLIFDAAKEGNVAFLTIIASKYPDLILRLDEEKYSIFHTAVSYRHKNVFKLIRDRPSVKNAIVSSVVGKKEDTILHLAAKLPPDQNRLKTVSGAALQMQRELWWFKEVSGLMPPNCVKALNEEGKTAHALFTESHKDLMKEGEEWMKKTAESCMLVATLIAAVIFAAAFTVPGGLNDDTGVPNFVEKTSFITFAIWDTISLVSSACSILTFLSILTARYAVEDFLWFLPIMLLFGLFTLHVSIIGMMVVFCTTLFIVFVEGTKAPFVLGIALAYIPVLLFGLQQTRLIFDVFGLIFKSLGLKVKKTEKQSKEELEGKQLKKIIISMMSY